MDTNVLVYAEGVNGADRTPPEPILRDVKTIENRDALGARHATLVQLDDARSALNVVLGADPS